MGKENIITEDSLFERIEDVDLAENLRDQVLFWKNIEQICLSKQSLGRLISNLAMMSTFCLDDEKYNSLRCEYEEYLNVRQLNYFRLRSDAIKLLNSVDQMFSPNILDKVELVSFALNKQ